MSASFLHFSRNEVEYVPKNGMELLRVRNIREAIELVLS